MKLKIMEKSLIINEPIEVEAEEVFKVKINGKDHYLNKEEYDKYKEKVKYIEENYNNKTLKRGINMIERIKIIKEDKDKIIIKNKEDKIKIVKGDIFELNKREEVDDDLLVGGNGDETIV